MVVYLSSSQLGQVDRYLARLRQRGLSDNTRQTYAPVIKAYLRAVDPLTVDAEGIEAWLDSKRLNAKSRRCYIAALVSFHRWLCDTDQRADDPTLRVVRPRVPKSLPRPIAASDLRGAMASAEPRMRLWLCLAAYGGLRCCEIAGLRVDDVDLESEPPMLHLVNTKGAKHRALPVADETLRAMKAYSPPASGWLFCPELDLPLRSRALVVSKAINRYLRSLKIRATAHQLRHYFGTELFRSTRNLRLVQDFMGHSDISTTAGYVALVPDQVAIDAVRAMSV
jgi:integrase/recombinase XerD